MTTATVKTKDCATCGASFSPNSNRARYCTPECKVGPVAVCEHCGESFRSRRGSRPARFCSRDCWYAWPGRVEDKPCPVCGEAFRPKDSGQVTCSVECSRVKRRTGVRATHCKLCGAQLAPDIHPRVRYCSKTCASRDRVKGVGSAVPVGSRVKGGAGYMQIKTEAGWRIEHRVVMEQVLGRTLEPHERVHHKNGQRDDNRPENLELWKIKAGGPKKDPAGVRASDYHCPGCRCGERAT